MYSKVVFQKPPKSIDKLVDILLDRGMSIQDKDVAKDFLSKVNYYRLSGYWFQFQNKYLRKIPILSQDSEEEIEQKENLFVENVSFENIIDIYKFDSKLRSLCLDALEKIEIAVGTIICNHMCETKGPYWFLNKDNISLPKHPRKDLTHDELLKRFDDIICNNHSTPYIKSFHEKYSNQYPPYWILSQLITFGLLSKIYKILLPSDKKNIAMKLGCNINLLENSLHVLSYVRNVCAHYARLWDASKSLTPANIDLNKTERNAVYNYKFHTPKNNTKFFPVFYLISFFLHELYPSSNWVSLVDKKIQKYTLKTKIIGKEQSLISFTKLGFPDNWKELPLFSDSDN